MEKLFISQPMKGKTDEEIIHERNVAIRRAKAVLKEYVQVIDSFFEKAPADANPVWFLRQAIKLLSTADIVYFTVGWDKDRGCEIEHAICVNCGIPTIEASIVGEE